MTRRGSHIIHFTTGEIIHLHGIIMCFIWMKLCQISYANLTKSVHHQKCLEGVNLGRVMYLEYSVCKTFNRFMSSPMSSIVLNDIPYLK